MLCRIVPVFITVALVSCSAPNQGSTAPGSEYGYGTNNGNSRPYRSDGKVVASSRPYSGSGYDSGSEQNSSRYTRSPYGGGPDTRAYRNAYPMSYGYPGYGYPGSYYGRRW